MHDVVILFVVHDVKPQLVCIRKDFLALVEIAKILKSNREIRNYMYLDKNRCIQIYLDTSALVLSIRGYPPHPWMGCCDEIVDTMSRAVG
jgi:hypothetical protein